MPLLVPVLQNIGNVDRGLDVIRRSAEQPQLRAVAIGLVALQIFATAISGVAPLALLGRAISGFVTIVQSGFVAAQSLNEGNEPERTPYICLRFLTVVVAIVAFAALFASCPALIAAAMLMQSAVHIGDAATAFSQGQWKNGCVLLAYAATSALAGAAILSGSFEVAMASLALGAATALAMAIYYLVHHNYLAAITHGLSLGVHSEGLTLLSVAHAHRPRLNVDPHPW